MHSCDPYACRHNKIEKGIEYNAQEIIIGRAPRCNWLLFRVIDRSLSENLQQFIYFADAKI